MYRHSRTRLVLASLVVTACASMPRGGPAGTIGVPIEFRANRLYLRPVTVSGDTLLLYGDTGGTQLLRADVAAREHLPRTPRVDQRGDTSWFVPLPQFRPDAAIPLPPGEAPLRLAVLSPRDMSETVRFWPEFAQLSGELGARWFGDGVWTFDYLHHRLLLHPDGVGPRAGAPHVVPVGFKNVNGTRPSNFARIRVRIDGDSLDMLFDTGATVTLSDSAARAIGDGLPRERATSFVVRSVMNRWRTRHPDWRVLPNAMFGAPGLSMIEVPAVEVAGHTVGPVWFTERGDKDFASYMNPNMDEPILGAFGGSALQYFTVTLDYKRGLAAFER